MNYATLIAYYSEQALIEAIKEHSQFTVIGYINGELHIPSLGMVI